MENTEIGYVEKDGAVIINVAIKNILKEEHMNMSTISRLTHRRNSECLTKLLKRENMSVSTAVECLNVLGYEFAIRKMSARKPVGEIIIAAPKKIKNHINLRKEAN